MDDKTLLTQIATQVSHIDEKTDDLKSAIEKIQLNITDIQKDVIITMANNSQIKERIEKNEDKFEKTKAGIYSKIETIESNMQLTKTTEVNKLYEYVRDLFKTEKQENENIKSELRKEFCEQIKINTELIFNKMKLWVYGGIIAVFLMLTKDVILNILR